MILALTGDTLVVVIGGVIGAVITAGLAFAGVVVSARAQKTPAAVAPAAEVAELRADLAVAELRLLEVTADRDVWRDLARQWMPRPPAAD